MPTLRFTQLAIERLKPPVSGRVEYWDATLPGFGLRISAPRSGQDEGRRTWQALYRVNGKLKRETIGTTATIPKLAEARERARESLRKAQQKIDPVAESRRQAAAAEAEAAAAARTRDTLGAVIDRYLAERAKPRMRPDYYKEARRALIVEVRDVLGADRPIRQLTRRDIREMVGAIVARGKAPHAAHVLAYTKTLMNWALAQEVISENPAVGIPDPDPRQHRERERDRTLNDAELHLFWLACDKIGLPFGPLFKLLVLTAQRRDEVAHSTWNEFDLDKGLWHLSRHRTKNGRDHLIHLAPAAREIIGDLPRISGTNFLFTTTGKTPVSGFGRPKARVYFMMRARAGDSPVEPFTIHDLRRSAATGMAELGVAHHVVDRVLNHSTGAISGIARIYNRNEYLIERKAALETWARHIETLIRPHTENVVTLTTAVR
jgi:integrase